ncbi:iron dicitrate transport regulator FecR [Leptospira selangorensis]|uniref:Iron dicitrate transport regulator FecR n=1 Tax=Leptospira selangorensis TaxID=2484982 RepID=A0A5F2C278_9LEPT|nr:FecR family protein [Leptospira selangorensis]TGM16076.1 iron dicitrate transport regulator FecR [Leptospira selangorensis]TGM17973.1 iron dicitrate transport regulator FecR [Leptospira selangorensis]
MNRKLFLLFLIVTFIGFSNFCSKILNTKSKPGLVVIFLTGKVEVERNGKLVSLSLGSVLQKNDTIKTKSGTLDLQTSLGHVIRLKPYTNLSIESLHGDLSEETSLAVRTGLLLVKTNKLSQKEQFKISTPTAIAGVRGTAFSFEVVQGTLPKIKVYEGMVAMTLKAPVSQVISADKISENPNYQKLQKLLEENEIVISEEEEAEVKPEFDQLAQTILNQLDDAAIAQSIESFRDDLVRTVQRGKFERDPRESADLETLVKIDEDLISGSLNNKSLTKEIEKDQSEKLNIALDKVESIAGSQKLDSEEEIKKYYSVLESIHKLDKTVLHGAVVTQVGNTMLVHSTKGIFRLDVSEVEYIKYKNFDVITKKKK